MTRTIHFIGFRADEYISAIKVWGLPDFIHRDHDPRAYEEIAQNDIIIFGKKYRPQKYNWDASRFF